MVQLQSRKYVLNHAGYTATTRQHELDHTDHTDHTDQRNLSALEHVDCSVGIDHTNHLSEVCKLTLVQSD